MATVITILVFILILSVLVLIHEAGHYFVAKWFGVKVEEFGFGFPPRVFGKKIGDTIYSINLLPIGGFVKLYGEDDAGSGKIGKIKDYSKLKNKDLRTAFFVRPVWQRASIVVAGVIMNFLLALVIISYLFTVQGIAIPSNKVLVTEILPQSPAQMAGLKTGDVIVSIDNTKITSVDQVPDITSHHPNQPMIVSLLRAGKQITMLITPKFNAQEKRVVIGIGIAQDVTVKKYKWYEAPFAGLVELIKETWMILAGLGSTAKQVSVQHTVPKDLAGPVGIAQLTGEFVKIGINPVLSLVSLLSLNLAIMNVLPIPALDGGRLFFILVEGITGQKVNQKFEAYTHMVGMIVLLTLIALLTFHDVFRWISGESLLPK